MKKQVLLLVFLMISGMVWSQTKSSRNEADARLFIDSLYKLVITGKSNITTLARLYSEDPGSAKDGGLINHVKPGMLVPEFENVINVSKAGDISAPFKTQYGYHFLQLLEKNQDSYTLRHILITFQ